MSMTVERFLLAFPEFKDTKKSLIQQKITAADLRIQSGTWGDLVDQGRMFLTAHLLSLAPEGEQARLKKENRVTMYQLEYERMKRAVTFGLGRVA